MQKVMTVAVVAVLVGLMAIGCQRNLLPTQDVTTLEGEMLDPELAACPAVVTPPPSGLVTVSFGSKELEFFPYADASFSGHAQDPINLIFVGKADPRDIRAALMSLPGDRSALGFPPQPPFNQQWTDAIGDVETAWGRPDGWTGSVIQLACGDYGPIRFHLRLFKQGEWTVANAHFDLLIPGTTDHQVISWELAKQFVIADFMRSGLLDEDIPMIPTASITSSPFRTIPSDIYNVLPVELRALIGGPLGDVTSDVGIQNSGQAMILNLAGSVSREYAETVQDFIIDFDQVIPKPFCDETHSTYLYAKGTVHLYQRAALTPAGVYQVNFQATGTLTVVPVNPLNRQPIGEPLEAQVWERHSALLDDNRVSASSDRRQQLGTLEDPGGGSLFVSLRVASNGRNGYDERVACSTVQAASELTMR
jgi:hypothetical protein